MARRRVIHGLRCCADVGRNFGGDTGHVFFDWPSCPRTYFSETILQASLVRTTSHIGFAWLPTYCVEVPYSTRRYYAKVNLA